MSEEKNVLDERALIQLSKKIRAEIIETSHITETMHVGGCLSCVDILISLYFGCMSIRPKEPQWSERDRFILSKGHAALAYYSVLAHRGYFPRDQVLSFNKDKSRFTEHPVMNNLPGIEATSGSLGHGLGIGCGITLAGKIRNKNYRTFVLMSDGECNEGSVWEAALFASANSLRNLIVIVDYNKWQACGRSTEILKLSSLKEKFSAFGWTAYDMNGHDICAMTKQIASILQSAEKPVAIIAHTTKGKGVSFMEDDNNWHYRIPSSADVTMAFRELGVQ